jgi:hypothetical protein
VKLQVPPLRSPGFPVEIGCWVSAAEQEIRVRSSRDDKVEGGDFYSERLDRMDRRKQRIPPALRSRPGVQAQHSLRLFFTDNSSDLADHTPTRLSPATRIIAATLRSTSSSVVAQLDTLIRIAACPCHRVPPHQQVPSF